MIRRIVLIRSHEWLQEAWEKRSFAAAGLNLENAIKVRGAEFDEAYHPVWVAGNAAFALSRPPAAGFNYLSLYNVNTPATYSVRAAFEDEEAIARIKADRQGDVVGVFADPTISVMPSPYCGVKAVGTHQDVARKLGVAALKKAGMTGKKVRIVVVDTGIDGSRIPVRGGWSPVPDYEPGTAPPTHGTMVAFDARLAAPDATILDYALLQSNGQSWSALLSDAISAFANLIALLQSAPGPMVVNNSWGMYNRAEDTPIGSPENYSANPDHPFNQIVGSLVAAGADVLFAAGNCGADCPDGRCGLDDIGPGASIHGANSHPEVITVAAVTVTDRRLGYSSQGPGGLYRRKPDVAAYSHFAGSGVFPADTGTSAACPVAAGVVAALRQKLSVTKRSPASIKGLLQRTAIDLQKDGWDYDIGYGVIDAAAAVKAMDLTARRKK
jgi:hypothetical protein